MAKGKLILVCGSTGAGKTSHTIELCADLPAVRFSIDPWMQTMFGADMHELDYDWMIERVYRCYDQIWEVAAQVLATGGHVVLDLGFTERSQRERFYEVAQKVGVTPELHFLDIPADMRRQRVAKRNEEKDPAVYSFEVTDFMFDFMESKFEAPTPDENIKLVIFSAT